MTFEIVEVSSETALEFFKVNSSGSVFHHPKVAECLGSKIEWWQVNKGSEPFQLFPVSINNQGSVEIPPFSYYFGPYWSDRFSGRPISTRFSDSQIVFKLILEHLAQRYTQFQFELGLSDTDVRPFIWWNHEKCIPELKVVPRYSAVLPDLQVTAASQIEENFRSLRRREIRRVTNSNRFVLTNTVDWREVASGYSQTLLRSGSTFSSGYISQSVGKLQALADSEMSQGIAFVDRESGSLASFVFLLRAKGVSNLTLSFVKDDFRESGLGAYTMREAILTAKKLGDTSFDFNGANSPFRGDDKHSYGAVPALYFRLESSIEMK